MTTTLEILTGARDLIAQPYRWTKGDMHRVRTVKHEKVDCFCAVGAMRHAGGVPLELLNDNEPLGEGYRYAIVELNSTIASYAGGTWRITSYNDTHKKREVLALFDATIARLKEQA